ncbi:low temperature-induced protein lt101.2-like [Miscanthus floridulus]|uniref:low temperature-induced protein lt101.2-like n=1 Tax=Miscanthus floridulus TaxID=154761 RepID=UPI0034578D9E
MSSGGCSTCLEVIFAIVLPPLGVFFRYGCCSSEFFISLLLTALCYVPGIVYSLYVILRTPPEPPGIDGERPYDMLA